MAIEGHGRPKGKEPDERGQEELALSRRKEGLSRTQPTPPLRYGTLFGGALPSREKILSVTSVGALVVGLLLLVLTAPWSPVTGSAGAQISGDAEKVADSSDSFGSTTGTTGDTGITSGTTTGPESGGSTGGGFAPSVLPDEAPAVETESETDPQEAPAEDGASSGSTGALPEASPGGSAAEERHGQTTELDATPGEPGEPGGAAGSTCTDYATQEEAQAALDAGEYGLDEDGDGAACEAYFGTGTYDYVSPEGLETGGMPQAAVWAKIAGLALMVAGAGGLGLVLLKRLSGGRSVS